MTDQLNEIALDVCEAYALFSFDGATGAVTLTPVPMRLPVLCEFRPRNINLQPWHAFRISSIRI